MKIVEKNGLKISSLLYKFINNEAIPGTDINSEDFWNKFSESLKQLVPKNKILI